MQFRRARTPIKAAVLLAVAAVGVTTACGRSSNVPTGGGATAAAPSSSAATTSASAGDFGTLKAICGPGSAKGATGRGVTDTDDPHRRHRRPGRGRRSRPGAGVLRHRRRLQQVVQRRRRHQRPQDRRRQVGREALQRRPGDDQRLPEGLHAGRQRQRVRQRRREDARGLQARRHLLPTSSRPRRRREVCRCSVDPSNPNQYPYGALRLLIDGLPGQPRRRRRHRLQHLASLVPPGKRSRST